MKEFRTLCCLTACFAASICLFSNKVQAQENKQKQMTVSSYIRTWPLGSTVEDQKTNIHWQAKDIKGQYLTDLIVAFGRAKADGTITFPDVENPEQPFKGLWKEIARVQKQFPKMRIHVSIGGWGADQFSSVAASPLKRATFIKEAISLVKSKKLDGIDIDWEYPVGPDWGEEIPHSPEDGDNFILLLSELRSELTELGKKTGKQYLISIAAPGSTWYVQKIDVVKIASLVDSIKLMTYDYYGGWSGTTGHHANLFNNPADPAWGGWSTAQTVDTYLAAGVPASKLVVGVAFYGRAWKGVADADVHGLYQKFTESAYPDGLSWPDLKKFIAAGSGYTRYWDDVAKAPYLYNGDTFITYTDVQEIAEIGSYAKQKGLGGVMTWEYGHDVDAELLKPLFDSVQ